MITTAAVVDPRRSTDFTHPDDERVLQQPSLAEIVKQRGPADVHCRNERFVSLKIVSVSVIAALPDFDERHTRLNQASSGHEPSAQLRVAVLLPVFLPFGIDIEGLPDVLQTAGPGVGLTVHLCRLGLVRFCVSLFHEIPQPVPTSLDRRRETRFRKRRQSTVFVEAERRVPWTDDARSGISVGGNLHKVRQVGFRVAAVLGDDRPDLGKTDGGGRLITGMHQVNPAGMVDLRRLHRADDGQLVHALSDVRHQLANSGLTGVRRDVAKQPAGRSADFHVKRFKTDYNHR